MALESTRPIVHLGDEGSGGFVIWQKLKANYSQLVGSPTEMIKSLFKASQ